MPRLVRFPKDGANSHVGVLQIWRGVSLERQHSVPGKNVVGHPILGEIGVFDRADADYPCDVDLLFFAQFRIFFVNDLARANARSFE